MILHGYGLEITFFFDLLSYKGDQGEIEFPGKGVEMKGYGGPVLEKKMELEFFQVNLERRDRMFTDVSPAVLLQS
jgi:hypothetical protein